MAGPLTTQQTLSVKVSLKATSEKDAEEQTLGGFGSDALYEEAGGDVDVDDDVDFDYDEEPDDLGEGIYVCRVYGTVHRTRWGKSWESILDDLEYDEEYEDEEPDYGPCEPEDDPHYEEQFL